MVICCRPYAPSFRVTRVDIAIQRKLIHASAKAVKRRKEGPTSACLAALNVISSTRAYCENYFCVWDKSGWAGWSPSRVDVQWVTYVPASVCYISGQLGHPLSELAVPFHREI